MMYSKGFLLVTAFMFICVSLLMPAGANAGNAHIKSAGCKTEYFLLKELAAAYQKETGTKLRTASTGNKKAMNLMLTNEIDFAFTCKPIGKLAKKLKLDPNKVGNWKSIPIAKDPIFVILNSNNGVGSLTVEQLTAIFKGEIKNWSEVGGADLPIQIAYFDEEIESGSQLLLKELTVGTTGEFTANAKKLGGPSMLGNFVSRTAGGISFLPLNSYEEKFGTIAAINGVLPSRQSIEDGSYKLAATYHLTVAPAGNGAVRGFVEYCMSEKGQQVIAKNFIPYSK